MSSLLDTNVAIALLTGDPPQVRDRFRTAAAAGEPLGLSTITVFELWYGVHKSSRVEANKDRLRVFLSGGFPVVPFGEEDAEQAGELRARLEAAGAPVGPFDLLIAAQALRHGMSMITSNVREFGRIPGLRIEDWSARKRRT